MCGIFGAINTKLNSDLAWECVNRMTHRGPDDKGLWQENGVTLGHRRLSILDLSERGRQPMPYMSERYMLAYNGEIFNFLEIRKELEGLGYTFVSDSDSEVLLASFVEWKEKCLDKFNGMWAFAIWDREEKRMFLSRDRFGVKPLYYTCLDENEKSYAFGSEMKVILPLIKERKPNRNLVCDPNRIVFYESTDE